MLSKNNPILSSRLLLKHRNTYRKERQSNRMNKPPLLMMLLSRHHHRSELKYRQEQKGKQRRGQCGGWQSAKTMNTCCRLAE